MIDGDVGKVMRERYRRIWAEILIFTCRRNEFLSFSRNLSIFLDLSRCSSSSGVNRSLSMCVTKSPQQFLRAFLRRDIFFESARFLSFLRLINSIFDLISSLFANYSSTPRLITSFIVYLWSSKILITCDWLIKGKNVEKKNFFEIFLIEIQAGSHSFSTGGFWIQRNSAPTRLFVVAKNFNFWKFIYYFLMN